MYSDAVSLEVETAANGVSSHETERVYAPWKDWQPSRISHHGSMCCEIAREWLVSMDHSSLGGGSCSLTGPRWLRQKFKWGASSFPIHWCEVVRKTTLDCGALAALAAEVFDARGVRTLRVQMVQQFTEVATSQWSENWNGGETLPWTRKDVIYHEGCAVVTSENNVKIWDSSAGWWVDPKISYGYGSLLAVRISDCSGPPGTHLAWGSIRLREGDWIQLEKGAVPHQAERL